MRIAIVTTSFPASNEDPAGHFVMAHVRELEGQGHQVDVIRPRSGGAFGWPGVAARVAERPHRALEAALWIATATAAVTARVRLGGFGPDVVIAHWAVPSAWPIAVTGCSRAPPADPHAPRAPHTRLEVISHGGDVRLLAAMPRPLRHHVVRAIAARASAWTFASDRLRETLYATLDADTRARVERIARVAAPAIEMPDVHEAIARLRVQLAGTRTAVSVGRLVASKRVDRAIEHVAAASDLDALVVVGDGPERPRLERLARERGVTVRFVGAVGRREALAWIGAAEALLHASIAEGLSTVVREAEALGTRVVRI